jgi:filamentous hemagglutinin family protein
MEIKMTITAPASVSSCRSRRGLLLGCALAAVGGMAGTAKAQAFNATPSTIFGSVTYNRATPGIETITVNTDTAVINWRPTDPLIFLPGGNVATFQNGPVNAGFVVLNRILATTPMRFDGTVLSRLVDLAGTSRPGGTVIFSSPGGLIIGGGAVFDVGSLVLTTLNVDVDAGGNFYDPATRGLNFSNGDKFPTSAVVTEPGAQLRALQPDSYVALVGPVIQHGGSTRVNGSAAYIAGEQVQFRANQGLFDIIVDVGSDNAVPLIHSGSTGGPASTGAADQQAIYLVAMPKNQAITAVLQGDIGFDPAVAVGVENGVIVLSAGANVVAGNVDRYGHATATPAPNLAANFEINGGIVRSDLTGVARTSIRARPIGAPTLTFQQDVSLFGGSFAAMSVTTSQTIDVLGNAIVSAAAFDTSNPALFNLTGGQARIFTQDGGTIHIAGTATVDASARGLTGPGGNAGSGTGGSADVTASGGTITIDGALGVLATGEGGVSAIVPLNNGGAGSGGTATLAAAAGGTVNAGNVVLNANGSASASASPTTNGAAGTGGTVNVLGSGGGTVVIAGTFGASASGAGGDLPGGAGLSGGTGTGGTINVRATDGDIDFNANAGFVAAGGGGIGPQGGNGLGGTLNIEATRGTIDFLGQVNGAVGGFGGNGSVLGGPGGDGRGGTILISSHSSDAPARISGGAVTLAAPGQGGRGANGNLGTPAGDGGDGIGGSIAILAESANGTIVLGALKLAADGQGGDGGDADNDVDGGSGGAGTGGDVLVGTAAGPARGCGGDPGFWACVSTPYLPARGTGGFGGLGAGSGGPGTGGTVAVTAIGAAATVTGPTNLVAEGQGSPGGGSPGGAIGTTGLATGGTVNINAAAHPGTGAAGTLTLAAVTGSANAQGDGPGNAAGSWHVGAASGSTVTAASLTLTAAADGAGIGVPPASTLDPQDGTITVTGTALLGTDGDIVVNAAQAGRIAGGRYELTAGRDVTFSHLNPQPAGFTIDSNELFVLAGRDFGALAGVATRTAGLTDIRATGNVSIAGRISGATILLRSVGLDVAATGAVGTSGTATTDIVASGAATVAGQIGGVTVLFNSGSLDVAASGTIGTPGATLVANVQAAGNAVIAGQIRGETITLRSAALTVAAAGAVGGADTASLDAQATGNASIAGQLLGAHIILRSAGLDVSGRVGGAGTNSTDILATGAATVVGQISGTSILLDAASLDLAASGTIGDGAATNISEVRTAGNAAIAGQVSGATVRLTSAAINVAPTGQVGGAETNVAELRATGTLTLGGRLLGADILAASSDIDILAGGAIGDASTQTVRLAPNATGLLATLGGAAQGPGYTLTNAEAGRIRAGTLRVDAPALGANPALLVRDLTLAGGGAATGIGLLDIVTPGVVRVEGALLMTGARAADGIAIDAGQRLEVVTPAASVRVRDGAGVPGGRLTLASDNVWIASAAIIDLLRANSDYAGRDDDLIDNDGVDAPRGYVEADGVTITTGGTLYVQNTTAARGTFLSGSDFGGITTGPGGLTIVAAAPNTNVYAFGRRLNADGSFTTGDDFFFQSTYEATAGATYTPIAAVNTCIIVTGQCPLRVPPDTGPDGPDPFVGPTDGSMAILLPQNDEDDVIDSSFAADPLIEEPVTSGSEAGLPNCDPDHDGDCDDQPR